MIGTPRTSFDQQIAIDHAVHPLREAIREMRQLAADALADGGARRPHRTALADISRVGAAALEAGR